MIRSDLLKRKAISDYAIYQRWKHALELHDNKYFAFTFKQRNLRNDCITLNTCFSLSMKKQHVRIITENIALKGERKEYFHCNLNWNYLLFFNDLFN